jgi:hypothetical protein
LAVSTQADFLLQGTAVNIPRRQDRAKVIVIKWK